MATMMSDQEHHMNNMGGHSVSNRASDVNFMLGAASYNESMTLTKNHSTGAGTYAPHGGGYGHKSGGGMGKF